VLLRLAPNRFLSTEQIDALVQPQSRGGQFRHLQRLMSQLADERYINLVNMHEQMRFWPRGGGSKSRIYGIGDVGAKYLSDLGEEITVGVPGYRRKQTNFRLSKLAHRISVNHLYVACVRNATSLDHVSFEWESEDEYPAERIYSRVTANTGTVIEIPFNPDGLLKITTRTDEERERHFLFEFDNHTETLDSETHGLTTKTVAQKARGYLEIFRSKGKCDALTHEEIKRNDKPLLDEHGGIQKKKVWHPRRIDFGFTVLIVSKTVARRDSLRKAVGRHCRNAHEASFFWFAIESDYYDINTPLVWYDKKRKTILRQMDYQNLTRPIWYSASTSDKRYALIETTSQK